LQIVLPGGVVQLNATVQQVQVQSPPATLQQAHVSP
jgi:hypothetical protein